MKKYISLLLILIITTTATAQMNANVKLEKKGDLIEATYYYEDGTIQQRGTFKDGQLHGIWTSYDFEGNKLAVGNYENGEKAGKWFFWHDDSLKEVDYSGSKIVSVSEWENKNEITIRN